MTSCCRSPTSSEPRILFLPTASGDTTAQINALQGALRRPRVRARAPVAVPPARRPRARWRRSCSTRTSSTSAAARCATCSRSGARTGSTACSCRRGERGIVLAGLSAGAMCWFQGGITCSSGPPEPIAGLGLLEGSLTVHADGEPERLPVWLASVRDGTLPGGWAVDDGVGLLFRGERLERVVSSRPGAGAQRVDAIAGELVRQRLDARAARRGPARRRSAATTRPSRNCGASTACAAAPHAGAAEPSARSRICGLRARRTSVQVCGNLLLRGANSATHPEKDDTNCPKRAGAPRPESTTRPRRNEQQMQTQASTPNSPQTNVDRLLRCVSSGYLSGGCSCQTDRPGRRRRRGLGSSARAGTSGRRSVLPVRVARRAVARIWLARRRRSRRLLPRAQRPAQRASFAQPQRRRRLLVGRAMARRAQKSRRGPDRRRCTSSPVPSGRRACASRAATWPEYAPRSRRRGDRERCPIRSR